MLTKLFICRKLRNRPQTVKCFSQSQCYHRVQCKRLQRYTSSGSISTRPCFNPIRHSTLGTSLRSGHPARLLLQSLRLCTPCAQCWTTTTRGLRICLRLRFFEGVWYGQSRFVVEQIGAARNTGQCLQLVTWFFFETTLTALSWPELYLHSLISMPVLFRDRR